MKQIESKQLTHDAIINKCMLLTQLELSTLVDSNISLLKYACEKYKEDESLQDIIYQSFVYDYRLNETCHQLSSDEQELLFDIGLFREELSLNGHMDIKLKCYKKQIYLDNIVQNAPYDLILFFIDEHFRLDLWLEHEISSYHRKIALTGYAANRLKNNEHYDVREIAEIYAQLHEVNQPRRSIIGKLYLKVCRMIGDLYATLTK